MAESEINKVEFWNDVYKTKEGGRGIYPALGRYKSEEFLHLFKRWGQGLENKRMLKTDLCEEAFGLDQVLFSLTDKTGGIFACDISEEVVKKAAKRKDTKRTGHKYLSADVRKLPFKENTFDFIISTSTLDHFADDNQLIQSLKELKRVLKPKGVMIVALNNKNNINFYSMLKIQEFFKFKPYLSRFYNLKAIRKIFKEAGLYIQKADTIVHIISPLNSMLWLLRKFIKGEFVDNIAYESVLFFKWIGSQKSRSLTGWFTALKCVKRAS